MIRYLYPFFEEKQMDRFGHFMMVDADDLGSMPLAFRQYVRRYFVEDEGFYWAHRPADVRLYPDDDCGVAPRNVKVVDEYTSGLPDGKTLSQWIEASANKIPGLKEFVSSWEDGSEIGHHGVRPVID